MRLWVDFNEIENDTLIEADLEFAEVFRDDDLEVGRSAFLFDGGGHECTATVVGVHKDAGLVRLKIDWQTWDSPARRRMFQRQFSPAWSYERSSPGPIRAVPA